MRRGRITGFVGSWGSGLAYLVIDGQPIACDNGPTVRALAAMFEEVVQPGHRVNLAAIAGQEVLYEVDELGLLSALALP